MNKHKTFFAIICVIIALALIAAVITIIILNMISRKHYAEIAFTESEEVFINPLKGYVPWAATHSAEYTPEPEFSLAFAIMYWSELEPEKGVYDFEAFEKRNNFEHLTSHNVKLIIRLISDYPDSYEHIDIPQWLFDESGGAGVFYENYGMLGFAPDYSNELIMERHKLAVQAIAERYDNSPDVAFIQLGSLGQWGEWHHWVSSDLPFPSVSVTDNYVQHYLSAFKEKLIQMRRPYSDIESSRIGFYNDLIGQSDSTYEWIGWIKDADSEDFYKTSPAGGEFSSNFKLTDYFGDMFDDVIKSAKDSHTTFIGGYPPDGDEYKSNGDELLKTIGYRFTVRNARYEDFINLDNPMEISIEIENTGAAPFYYKWDFCFYFYDKNGKLVSEFVPDWDIRDILPNEKTTMEASLPVSFEKGTYTFNLGILNPDTKQPGIKIANTEVNPGHLILKIGSVTVKEWHEPFEIME